MKSRIVLLNGGSSSGKTSLARRLQSLLLPDAWLYLGIDSLIDAAPAKLWGSPAGIIVSDKGDIAVGSEFRRLELAWRQGVAAIARSGAGVILDLVLLAGAKDQHSSVGPAG